jgi:hypothetical protein
LLLALIEENDPSVSDRLAASGARAADVLADLRRALGTGDDRLWDGILVTPRVRRVVASAEAALADDAQVEPSDLFEAVLSERGGLVADILEQNFGNLFTSARVAG